MEKGEKHTLRLIKAFFGSKASEKHQSMFQEWFISDHSVEKKQSALSQIWEEIQVEADKSTYDELKKLKKRIRKHDNTTNRSFYINFLRIAAIILLPLLAGLSVYFFKNETITVLEPELTEHFVPYGERKKVLLPDSSEVWLNSGSLLVYEKEFTGKTRSVYLVGEGNFDVKKDITPFIVKTKEINIEVLGTVFNVESYMSEDYSITTLERGKVRINTNEIGNEPVLLLPNEQLIYNKSSKTVEKRKIEAAKRSQWKQGYMVFQGSDIEYIMKSLERRFNVKVNYSPNKFEGRLFTVKFSPEENLNQVLELLKKICGFEYEIKKNIIYITN